MRSIELAVRIDHFRLDPDTKLHPEVVDFVDQLAQSVRKPGGIDGPVAQSSMIVRTFTEPAVIDDKQLHPHLRRPSRELDLRGDRDVEMRRLPRVVEHGAQPVALVLWELDL